MSLRDLQAQIRDHDKHARYASTKAARDAHRRRASRLIALMASRQAGYREKRQMRLF